MSPTLYIGAHNGMATFDRNKIRAFRLHAIVQNIGTACYCSYLEKHAIAAKFPSLTALLIDANEKSKLLQKFQGKDHVYSPYDDVGNLKPKYPQSADIIALHKLHDHCDLLKQNSVPANLNDWWNGKNYQKVFDTILRSESCLVGQPGAACLVLYHVRNNLLPGAHKNEFSLDEETYSKALDVVVPALKILGDHLGKRERDDIDKRVSEAKYKDIGEKEYDEVASIYKRDLASNRPEKGTQYWIQNKISIENLLHFKIQH